MVVLERPNVRVGYVVVENVVGRFCGPGRNGSEENLICLCMEGELMVRNSFIKK